MKESVTLPKQIADFLFLAYFDFSKGNIIAAIKRAYRDLNRTLVGLPEENERKILRENWNAILENEIQNHVLKMKFGSWDDFTLWHKSVCKKLQGANLNYTELTIGQAQKWLNMTLKYLYILGNERVPGIALNYEYFHIPIDNIIQKQILLDLNLSNKKQFEAWSRIIEYEEYLMFQKNVIENYKGRIPMDVEFELFNNALAK